MGSAIDKNGMTEAQFLAAYDVTRFFRPSVTVDAVLCRINYVGGRVLLIKRGGHPYLGLWAFPGGFVDETESCETAVARELEEETGITGVELRQLVTVSTPLRDPRCRNITIVYYAEPQSDIPAVGGDDAATAKWFDFSASIAGNRARLELKSDDEEFCEELELVRDAVGEIDLNKTTITKRGGMAFDHAKILCYLFDTVKRGIR